MTLKYLMLVLCLLFSGLIQAQAPTKLTVRDADSWRSGQSYFDIYPSV